MRTIDYDKEETANTENRVATDAPIEKKFGNEQRALNEGFAASDGVRGGTAETDGRVTAPEEGDDAITSKVKTNDIAKENPGLADN